MSNPNSVDRIKNLDGLEGANYAIKALSIAYDWAFQYLQDSKPSLKAQIENALTNFGNWLFDEKWYGTVFQNHGPWDSKAIAYIAASLGDSTVFDGSISKEQKNSLGNIALIYKSAKKYLEQIFEGVDWACSPDGGWQEGSCYFLLKELPELIEYAEVVCVYMNDRSYADAVFSKKLFKYAGEYLIQTTTPDGFFMKFSDTGQKSALPTEYGAELGYGDINNIGAGYISGYHLIRLYNRLKGSNINLAKMVKYYADQYCFKPPFPTARENKINRIYQFIWQSGLEPTITWNELKNLPEMSLGRYYEKSGIFISRQTWHDASSGTIVRFDANPYYINDHQHFGAGNFIIFKNSNLAIDGGRYTQDQNYRENTYRSSVSHNIVLFGDNQEIGQDNIYAGGNRSPKSYSQKDDYSDWATGINNVSINYHEPDDQFNGYDYKYRSMRIDLKNVYNANSNFLDKYVRQLVHIFRKNNNPDYPELIISHDFIRFMPGEQKAATWQMHFKYDTTDYGSPSAQNPMKIMRNNSKLFVKCLSPSVKPMISRPAKPVGNYNGRNYEESDFILRFISETASHEYDLINVLFPTSNGYDDREQFNLDVVALDSCYNSNGSEILWSNTIPNLDRNIVCCFVLPTEDSKTNTIQYHLNNNQTRDLTAHFIFGLKKGKYKVYVKKSGGDWIHFMSYSTKTSHPDDHLGVMVFETDYGFGDMNGKYGIKLEWDSANE